MKYKVAFGLILGVLIAVAEPTEEKRREINKSFKVSAATTFTIKNQFGSVHINSWEKNEIDVKVEIIAKGRNAERAQAILDKVVVAINESGSAISFITDLNSNMNTRDDESFEVNYTVSAPARNNISIENRFGDTYLGRRDGETELDLSYGNLKAGDFTGHLELELSFGKGDVGKTGSSTVTTKYSELQVLTARKMELEQKFSDVEIEEVADLNLESRYGSVEIGRAGKIDADAQFSGFSIEELTGSLYLEASYVSGFEIGMLRSSFSKVEIYGKFSGYDIELEDGLKADIEAEFSFADLQHSAEDINFYYRVKEDNRSEYKGRIGGGDPDKEIIVKSSYGDLRMR